ncbi:hypothetical protein JCM14467A_09720 [Vulcanisaeta sp. JCM 14467]
MKRLATYSTHMELAMPEINDEAAKPISDVVTTYLGPTLSEITPAGT